MLWLITAYCWCILCTGNTHGITKSGRAAAEGYTAACPPGMLHQLIHIEDVGVRLCEDTGGKIKGRRIDVYFENHDAAVRFGIKRKGVETWTKLP